MSRRRPHSSHGRVVRLTPYGKLRAEVEVRDHVDPRDALIGALRYAANRLDAERQDQTSNTEKEN